MLFLALVPWTTFAATRECKTERSEVRFPQKAWTNSYFRPAYVQTQMKVDKANIPLEKTRKEMVKQNLVTKARISNVQYMYEYTAPKAYSYWKRKAHLGDRKSRGCFTVDLSGREQNLY